MVPNPSSLSRRQLLAGLAGGAGLGGGVTVATGATRPTLLPNVLTDWATNYYPTPPAASSLWQPTVTEEHAREVVTLLAETEEAAKERWEAIDSDERRMRGSGGWLSSADESLEDGDYDDALFEATYGMQFAGEDLGEARAELGVANLDEFVDRSLELFDRIDAVVDNLESYPVVDPERDLAWYVRIELELQRGRHLAGWRGLDAVRDDGDGASEEGEEDENLPDITAYEPYEIGDITSGLLRAEIAVESAERYRDLLWTDVEGADHEYVDHLRSVVDDLENELEPMPTREEVEVSYIGDDVDSYGPYEFAHSRLAQWCFPTGISPPWETTVGDDFLVLQVLGRARGLADWRAHDYAVDELAVTPDDETFDSGHVLDEKRRARDTYRTIVGSDPTPFMAVLSEQAIGNIRVATVDRDIREGSSWKLWNERVQAYLYALLGRARLRAYPDVYDLVVDGR